MRTTNVSFKRPSEVAPGSTATVPGSPSAATDDVVLPVIEEKLSIDRRTVETGARVRVRTVQEQRTETVDEPRFERRVRIDRVPCDRPIDGPLEPRVEGDVIVVPVVEERLVLEKRLFLKEEIRIVHDDIERHEPQEVVLQGERVIVERQDRPGGPWVEVAVDTRSGHSPEIAAPPGERSKREGSTNSDA